MIDTEGIGHRIQRLRKEKGLTQEQVAESLDMSVNYLVNTGRFWKCQYQTTQSY
ncbi:helix-turn-helix domain-containing protein [Intestinimonas butyriciproducens]|uniref:helix-turn-helix domain-containing protein n=1 Tax=Intestinimonas butyriciproducens TaxID=1297617 RepID=UPI001A9ADEA1|nr:helix-turn-helix transcriptional regulator [Intestinimonas butyriciproducens]MDB7815944.1 helix-turn-helix transcriptional regulator [Intestinimonas butyriciproducens]MDB7843286.1 helix-turn-helix transcriptional regulator [Intestinimonas butyriciproducens]MDB7856966.1 helix-turn-helix transcriptional regulator [Intestinimonas butyriciproducens]